MENKDVVSQKEELDGGRAGVAQTPTGEVGQRTRMNLGPGDEKPKLIRLQDILRRSIETWQEMLPEVDTNKVLQDGSINDLIFMKLKDVFSAMLDAAVLSNSWLIVDRTDGSGSATADLILEMAIARGSSRPYIIAIDSLERLASAHPGASASEMFRQLRDFATDADCAASSFEAVGRELEIDFIHSFDEYEDPEPFADTPDDKLPFDVVSEHIRKDGTCNPARKWRYFYLDGLFGSATHYIIKNNEKDDFNMEQLGRMGFVFAHGDTRAYKRLRQRIQEGKNVVMLHNSGGCSTAFSWLQRVMAHSRPPPDTAQLRGPLKFLIANLSKANWVYQFGVPEMIMMRSLAERAPQLFRKQVVSVDIMSDSEEQTLEVITGCFASTGGVPELGLGNAETNVVFNAWRTHLMLCENAQRLWYYSWAAQITVWLLSLATTSVAVLIGSLGSGAVARYNPDFDTAIRDQLIADLERVALVLPILSALITTIVAKLLFRDKWSVCLMAASQIAAEIYKFRMATVEYDIQPAPVEDGEEPMPPLTAKEKSRLRRSLFVDRIQAFYGACLTELSQGSALRIKRASVSTEQRHSYRTNLESKPTFSQWFKIKRHVEKHYYKTRWMLPSSAFLTWVSGLRPYLEQRTLREELRASIEGLVQANKIKLVGKPLTNHESMLVRHSLAEAIGLPGNMLDKQASELRQLQRDIVVKMFNEQEEAKLSEGAVTSTSQQSSSASVDSTPSQNPRRAASLAGRGHKVAPSGDEEEMSSDPSELMRKMVMEMQGLKYGKLTKQEEEELKKRNKKIGKEVKEMEDDYLLGPLPIESYVVFRLRPFTERVERQATKLAWRLQILDVLGFIFNAAGAIFAMAQFSEWISLSVTVCAVLSAMTEFTQLRDQVVSCNLALQDLQRQIMWWDSLSVVRRRTPMVKAQIVGTVERAFKDIVDAHTTAASNTQISAEKKLSDEVSEDQVEE
jgi:hypothetical protein